MFFFPTFYLSVLADDWPQFRGPTFDGSSLEKGLLSSWPRGGPSLTWVAEGLGTGFGGPAVVDGFTYVLGTKGKQEALFCIDSKGKIIWNSGIGQLYDFQGNSWSGGPNATPTVGAQLVFCQGSQGLLAAFEKKTGSLSWKVDLPTDLDAEINPVGGGPSKKGWGFCGSPLLDDEKLVVASGGNSGLFTAFEAKSGKVLWRSDQVKDQATYSSVVPMTYQQQKFYLVATQSGIVAVYAKDGRIAWRYRRDTDYPDIVACSPVVRGNKVLLPVGHGGDCVFLSILTKEDGEIFAKTEWVAKEISNNHGGFVVNDGNIIGFHGKRAWTCQSLTDGKVLWSGRRNAIGAGNAILADGKVFILGEETGEVAMLAFETNSYKEISKFTLPKESSTRKNGARRWTHPVISGGKLFLRDQEFIFCYEIR